MKDTELLAEFASSSNEDVLEVINSLPYAYYRADKEGKVVAASRAMLSIMGFAEVDEIIGVLIADQYVDPIGRDLFLKKLAENENGVEGFEAELKNHKGEGIWVSTSAHYVRDKNGNITGVEGLVRDISDERALLREIATERNLFELVAQKINYAIGIHDVGGRHVYSNDLMKETVGLGMNTSEVNNETSIYSVIDPAFREDGQRLDSILLSGEPVENVELVMEAGGEKKYYIVSKVLLENFGSQYICSIMKDDSENRKQNAQVIQNSKLAALGELSAGVAHELNQPLNVIKLAVANLRGRGDSADQTYIQKKLAMIDKQVDRSSQIINQLRSFGRTVDDKNCEGDLVVAVQSTLLMFGQLLQDNNITVKTTYQTTSIPVSCDELKLEQMCLNLLSNSRDAIEERRAHSSPDEASAMRIEISVSTDSKQAVLTVKDTGTGVESTLLGKVLEPFFTTKEVGKGTGLGLSVSQGFVAKAGGTIELTNWAGGALATVKLPILEQK